MEDVFETPLAETIFKQRYSLRGEESWPQTCKRVTDAVGYEGPLLYMIERKYIPAGRYLHMAGKLYRAICNCYALRVEDSREGWADYLYQLTLMLASGGGLSGEYSRVRGRGSEIRRTGGIASGPVALMLAADALGAQIRDGGNRRAALGALLDWRHSDIEEFMSVKNWSEDYLELKRKDTNFHLPLEGTNISIKYGDEFLKAIHNGDPRAQHIFGLNMFQAMKTAEPGFSFNFGGKTDDLRNVCMEYSTPFSGDSCNLGTVFISRVKSLSEFESILREAVEFQIRGNIYTESPTRLNYEVRRQSNSIGIGLGGIHEWLMQRGYKYEVSQELHRWLQVWKDVTDEHAEKVAKKLGVEIPRAKRACAPNGTIGMLAETTGGIEPLMSAAYRRAYMDGAVKKYQYVVDSVVRRLIMNGVYPHIIEDAYDIDFERRVAFQAAIQDYTDMAISSTVNLPKWGSEKNNSELVKPYSDIVLRYATRLRGLTIYPDGAREGQPIERVPIHEAIGKEGVEYRYHETECKGGVCGI